MRKLLFILSLIGGLLSVPTNLMADEGQKKSIRLFLNTGELLDFYADVIDSITFTSNAQTIWYDDTCRIVAIEAIDSIWYMSPTLRLTSTNLDFGKVKVGNRKTLTAMLMNTSNFMETYMVLSDNTFSVLGPSDGIRILPGESRNLELTFVPSDSIPYSGLLSIASNATENGIISLPLRGEGVAEDSLEMDVNTPPMDETFAILLDEDDRIENYEGFKIMNFNGEFPLDIPAMARSKRSIRRAGSTLNQFSTNATISSRGLQLLFFTDPVGNPFLYTLSVPGEVQEFSFVETGIALLLSTPYLAPADESEYKNTVAILKQLQSFNTYVYNLRQEYKEAMSHNRTPDFSKVSAQGVWNELFDMVKDNHTLTLSGMSLKDVNVTPHVANFKLHNDFKRSLFVYASRLKMNESNLVVTDQQDITPTFSDVILKLKDYLIKLENQEFKDKKSEIKGFEKDDIIALGASQVMLDHLLESLAKNHIYQEEVPIWLPFIIDSGKSDYWDIVWNARWDLYWKANWNNFVGIVTGDGIDKEATRDYLQSNDASIFAQDEEMSFEFKGYDKIQLDIYGLGLFNHGDWDSFSSSDKVRILIALMYGAYFDVAKPFLKTITGFKEVGNRIMAKGSDLDLRYGAQNVWIATLALKFADEFCNDPKNCADILSAFKDRDIMKANKLIGKFALKELSKLPEEAENAYNNPDDENNKCTYINLLYHIGKQFFGVEKTPEAFRQIFKEGANAILELVGIVLKTTEACEAAMDLVGGGYALYNSNVKETFIINKYDRPYITILEPTAPYMTPNVTVEFKWDLNAGNNYGTSYLYDIEMLTETPDGVTPTMVKKNLTETSYKYNLDQLPNAQSAWKISYRIIAHHPDNPAGVYVMTDFIPLVLNPNYSKVAPPRMVDLGLPSGTLWAECNLGAKSYNEVGGYYAWGEVDSKPTFSWNNYKYSGNTSNSLTKYNTKSYYGKVDNKIQLEAADDKVKSDYGYYYSIPTKDDWEELMKYCEWSRFADGIMVRGIDANHSIIYLPLNGYRDGLDVYDEGKEGSYWSSTLDVGSPDNAYFVRISNTKPTLGSYYRRQGRCIRPVQHKAEYAAPSTTQQVPTLVNDK